MFHEHTTPKPQRRYRQTRLGRALCRLQQQCSPSTSKSPPWLQSVQEPSEKNTAETSGASPTVLSTKTSCINMNRKKIYLGRPPSSESSSSTNGSHSVNSKINSISNVNTNKTIESNKRTLNLSDGLVNNKKLKTSVTAVVSPISEEKTASKPSKHPAVSWP
ncbi:uncharacterized protein LOC108682962 [Hyalella azteca]|uniref:Uncharacterized protein LOC108682962 n=1 Tax=Hyalella azteca TaxID=294128 RepID=A0A979FXY9_HYAAZ|nr:uncharacterized protein LOC108682962 [Hyalella azteca]